MIVSCWDWPSLKYAYFIVEGERLDAGGWSASKGIEARSQAAGSDVAVSIEDCLPTLPKESYYAGVGDFCIGEIYEKRDHEPRQRIDLDAMMRHGTPQEVKIVELLRGVHASPVQHMRENQAERLGAPPAPPAAPSSTDRDVLPAVYYPSDRSLWEHLVPMVLSVGAGFALYRGLASFSENELSVRDVLLAVGAGTALGITLGQEATRNSILKA
jgi:hypothetical protein